MQWITAAHRDPFGPATWHITFDVTTPVELLRNVRTELLGLYLEDRHSDREHLFEDQASPSVWPSLNQRHHARVNAGLAWP